MLWVGANLNEVCLLRAQDLSRHDKGIVLIVRNEDRVVS